MMSRHYLPRVVPEELQGLVTLAVDLRWSWHHGADKLWRVADEELWQVTGNPWLVLENISDARLDELAADPAFLDELSRHLQERDDHNAESGWFAERHGGDFRGQIAYFSMEFGLSESLPLYSGGLGVLAGDHLKTACDLDVPLIGIGLLYQQGYFRQTLNADGEQVEFFPYNDPTMLPVVPLWNDDGEWIRVEVELPGRVLRLRTWTAQVGRRSLYLLDSNDPLNAPGDRGITSELYGGEEEQRLQQEIALGIGGWRLLEVLGVDCPVCHLNEGHAAFAILERARLYMARSGQSFDVALAATRAGNLFTTHTPVPAGFDRFPPALFEQYFRDFAEKLEIPLERLTALGRARPSDREEPFNMAWLALRGAGAVNAVSRLHGEVSRRIFEPLYPRWPIAEVPVGHVTNGVHMPTWDSPPADRLWTDACGKSRWRGELESVEEDLRCIGDENLWHMRSEARARLSDYLRHRIVRQNCGRGKAADLAEDCGGRLDPDALTLGFARRFAEYKRPNLLLHDPDRLYRLLTNRDRPVQLVIAGKAHPRDIAGKRLLKQWHAFLDRPGLRDRAVFVQDYDLVVAAQLVQGVDVWINTPRRPWEACGTSGMKVLVNGGVNVSELDGWWAEAFQPEAGWALGDGREHDSDPEWDAAEAEELYRLLECEVIPSFYERDEHGLPRTWIGRIRESMAHLTTRYSSNRMLREYAECYYVPMAAAYGARAASTAVDIEAWQRQLRAHWDQMHFGNVVSREEEGEHRFEVQLYLDDMPADAVRVELYADGDQPLCRLMARGDRLIGAANGYCYHAAVPADRPSHDYTPRVIPEHPHASVPLEAGYILWYR